MHACPPLARLKQLLAGDLAGAAPPDLEDHVRGCPRCQGLLEDLADDGGLREWRPADGVPTAPHAEPGLVAVLHRLHAAVTPPPTVPLSFPGPARRAGDLGSLGPYALETEVGRGGMGVVFRGRDEALQRQVAVKLLRPELNTEQARARFVREAQAMARVRHDHVVGVHAVADPPDGLPYFVMEYLAGETLAARLREQRVLPPRAAAELAAQAADGLAAAHAAGLVHRDVKPGNILLDPGTGRAKIGDFGLARLGAVPSGLTQEGMLLGTPFYMSPEQARGEEPDARTDVYSLGVTLYELLTGDVPFRGAAHLVLRQVLCDDPRPPRLLNDAVPRDLETICLKAMAREPARRYQSAAAFRDDLRRFLNGEPIRARPVGPPGRTWRWCRRNPVVAGLLAVLALALAGAVWQWQRAESNAAESGRQHTRAEENLAKARTSFRLLAVAHGTLANLHGQAGRGAEALAAYTTARELQERLVAEDPTDDLAQHDLALTYNNLGWLSADPHEALRLHERARAIRQKLLAANPTSTLARHDLARTYENMGGAHQSRGEWGECRRCRRRACDLLEETVRDEPAVVLYRRALADSYLNLGVALAHLEEVDEAVRVTELARREYQRLADADPGVANYLEGVVHACVHLGIYSGRKGRTAETLRWWQQIRPVLEKLIRDHPGETRYQADLAENLENLGHVYSSRLKQADDSLRCYQEAAKVRAALLRLPDDLKRHRALAEDLTASGQLLEFLGRKEAAAAFYEAARERALAVSLAGRGQAEPTAQEREQRRLWGEEALRDLQAGVRLDPSLADRLDAEPAWDPLRDRPEFRRLLPTGGRSSGQERP
jgi:serine/threonine-protein kinase